MSQNEMLKVGDFVIIQTSVYYSDGSLRFPVGSIAQIYYHRRESDFYELVFHDGTLIRYWHSLELILLEPGLVAAMQAAHAALKHSQASDGDPHGT